MAETERTIDVGATPGDLYAVITGYADYAEFLPEIERATVLSRDGGTVRVQFVLNIIKRITYTLDLVEEPPLAVRWSLVDGDLRANAGSWSLVPTSSGVRATYKVEVEVGMFVPGAIVSRLVGETLPATLQAFAARAERRSED